jgi:DNA repair protein RecO (recombination protein O)
MIKTRAIVLHRFPYSDSSFIVKALTEECGVISFIIKGAKRKESPFKGALDPLSLSEVVFRQNPSTDLQFVKEASIINWHGHLRASLMELALAQVMAEIVLRYAPPATPIPDEFTLLHNALAELDSTASCSASQTNTDDSIISRWLLDICDLWGYHLELGECSRCERPFTEAPGDFFPESGALICKSCLGVQSARAKPATLAGLWQLYLAEKNGLEAPQYLKGAFFVENALLSYLRNHIGFLKEIHSLSWLQEVRKLCSVQSK